MKLSALLSGLVFLGFACFAQAATTPISCNWVQTSVQPNPFGAVVTYSCFDGSVLAATRSQGYGGSAHLCSVNPASGYTYTGVCSSPTILKYVTTQVATQQCYTGSTTVFQPGPFTPPFNVAQFCGQNCPYSVQPLANYSYPPLRYTCL